MTESGDVTSVSGEGAVLAELEKLRAENETLRRQLGGAQAPVESRGWRLRWLSITCAVLAAILLPMAVFTVWARNSVLDTDQYVSTVAPLADNEEIQEAITFRVTEAVSDAADFRSIAEETLPAEAQILAGPIEAGAERVIAEIVGGLVATSQFKALWEDTNRVAHENVASLLKGESNDAVATADGRVVLQLGSIAEQAVVGLDERLGTDLAEQIPAEALDAEFVLVDSSELADAQTAVGWLDNLSWFSAILALGLFVGVVVFAEDRRSGVRRFGLALVVPMLLALLAYAGARDQYLAGLPNDVHNPDAAAAVFDILTQFLQRAFRSLLVLGVLVLLGAWVVGPSASAGKVRVWWDTLLGRAGDLGADSDPGPIPRWVAVRERALVIGAGVLGALTLVTWTRPTGLVVILVFVLTLLAMGAVRLVAEVGRRGDTAGVDQPVVVSDDPTVGVREVTPEEPEIESGAAGETTPAGR